MFKSVPISGPVMNIELALKLILRWVATIT